MTVVSDMYGAERANGVAHREALVKLAQRLGIDVAAVQRAVNAAEHRPAMAGREVAGPLTTPTEGAHP